MGGGRSGAGGGAGAAATRRARAGTRAGRFEEEAVEDVVAVRKQALTLEEEVVALRNDSLSLLGTSSLSLSLSLSLSPQRLPDPPRLRGISSPCPMCTSKHRIHGMACAEALVSLSSLVCLLPLAVSFVCVVCSLSRQVLLACLVCLPPVFAPVSRHCLAFV